MESKTDNEIIAEFMGFTLRESETRGRVWSHPQWSGEYGEKAIPIRYGTSWDWLMPVVQEIHKMGKMVTINFYDEGHHPIVTKIYSWGLGDDVHEREQESKSAIESVYRAVVEFIKWHNEQLKQSA